MDAKVLVEFMIKDICNPEDLTETGKTFEEMAREIIKAEGITGVIDHDIAKIIKITPVVYKRPATQNHTKDWTSFDADINRILWIKRVKSGTKSWTDYAKARDICANNSRLASHEYTRMFKLVRDWLVL